MDQAQDRVSGHLQVKGGKGARKWFALFRDGNGRRYQLLLGPAHVKESGRWTERGAVVWPAASGPRPTPEHLTPLDAQAALDEMLAKQRLAPPPEAAPELPTVVTLRRARDEWLRRVAYDRQRKPSTISDYRSQSERYLLGEFGADTPLAEITTEAIEEWQQRLIESEVLAHRTSRRRRSSCTRSSSARRRSAGSSERPERGGGDGSEDGGAGPGRRRKRGGSMRQDIDMHDDRQA